MASNPLHERSNSIQHDNSSSALSRPQSDSGSPEGLGTPRFASRLKNRLQLRNAGFRGPEIAARKVTPESALSSDISNTSAMQTSTSNLSDSENISPSGKHASNEATQFEGQRESSGILQEIANSGTVRQTKLARPRVTSGRFFSPTANIAQDVEDGPAHKRTRSVRARAKMNKARRSVSGETRQYVEHLETELSSAQAQISALGSPSATRELSATMRHLKAETKQLHEEIAEWEKKYEERVQEEVDRHFQLEASLRSRLRNMELEAQETTFRLQELESQLHDTTETLNATETANVNLEKRLEIMSEMLAASPTKLDFHIDERPRHGRQRSMLPRFPTAGALKSPERASFAAGSSPASSRMSMTIDQVNFSPEAFSSDDDHAVSEVNLAFSAYNGMQPPQLQRTNTKRRMRRFGAGSMGPKPLILPSTSHHDSVWGSGPPSVLSSVPTMERHEMSSTLPFAPEYHMPDRDASSRRQSSANSYAGSFPPSLPGSPILLHQPMFEEPVNEVDENEHDEHSDDEAMLEEYIENSPLLEISLNTTPTFGNLGLDLGGGHGRSLMDELAAAQTSETITNTESHSSPTADDDSSSPPQPHSSRRFHSVTEVFTQHPNAPMRLPSNTSVITTASLTPRHRRLHRRMASRSGGPRSGRPRSIVSIPPSTISAPSLSTLDNLSSILGTLFRSPVAMAKYLVETAQSRTRLPPSLFNVQWWLVGVLLGPMAKKRMLRQQKRDGLLPCCPEEAERRALISSSDSAEAYGTFFPTPMSSSVSPSRAAATRAHKRRSCGDGATMARRCPHHHASGHANSSATAASASTATKRSKHSPWLWLKFSLTLAIAVGVAFKDGPGSLLRMKVGGKKGIICTCCKPAVPRREVESVREERAADHGSATGAGVEDSGDGIAKQSYDTDEDGRVVEDTGGGGGGNAEPGKIDRKEERDELEEVMVVGGIGEAVGKIVEGGGGGSEAPG